jgi:hypothetical protein
MGHKHIPRDDFSYMLQFLAQQRFCSLGFQRKSLIPKPDYPADWWLAACAALNKRDLPRRERLLSIDPSVFSHREMIRTYGAIVYIMLCQAPTKINITYDLIQRVSKVIEYDGKLTDTPVDRHWIRPVMDIISQTDTDGPVTRAFIRVPGYRDPEFPRGVATRLYEQDLSMLPSSAEASPELALPPTQWTPEGSSYRAVMHRVEIANERALASSTKPQVSGRNSKTQIGVYRATSRMTRRTVNQCLDHYQGLCPKDCDLYGSRLGTIELLSRETMEESLQRLRERLDAKGIRW